MQKQDNSRYAIPAIALILLIGLAAYMFMKTTSDPVVVFQTSMGSFEVELFKGKAPISTENFLSYVKAGYYDGLIFHRVIGDFMIQGGGFDSQMKQKQANDPIRNEAGNGLKNEKYTLAMARTSDVDSATSQFFVNVEDNSFLDHRDDSQAGYGYAVFGKVISGFDTIEKIRVVKTKTVGPYENVPATPVVIIKASVK